MMEFKTPMIAEKLGVSPKVVMRIVQQLNLEIKKNKFGHYIFNESDVQKIMASYEACQETAAASQAAEEEPPSMSMNTSLSPQQLQWLQAKWEEIEERLERNEERLREKADNVVQYQLLQHRSEIEELQQRIVRLEEALEKLQEQKEVSLSLTTEAEKAPKRRNIFASIFGFQKKLAD